MQTKSATILAGLMLVLLGTAVCQPAPAQDMSGSPSIAVVRLGLNTVSEGRQASVAAQIAALHASLRSGGLFGVPGEEAILAAIDDEGIDAEELIDFDDLFDIAEELQLDYAMIGSVVETGIAFETHVRVYAAADRKLIGVVSMNLPFEVQEAAVQALADRIADIIKNPPSRESVYTAFTWSQPFGLSLIPDRLSRKTARVLFVNDYPPFELGAELDMDIVGGMLVVVAVRLYADDEAIGTVYPDMAAPLLLREETAEIDGHSFCFQVSVRELRGGPNMIQTLNAIVTAKYCGE